MSPRSFGLVVGAALAAPIALGGGQQVHATVFASEVVADQTSGLRSPFNNATAAVGSPNGITGAGTPYQTVLSPFNPAFSPSDVVAVGEGGQLTLAFPNYVHVGGGSEVGVVSSNFLVDTSYPNGQNANPAQVFGSNIAGGGSGEVRVSQDGTHWVSIGTHTFDRPANFYQDAAGPQQPNAGSVPADFGIPFTHPISDFSGLDWTQTRALFGASGGGTWLDLGLSGLADIAYVQFQVPDDGDASTHDELVIDAVSVNNQAVGAAVPEPSAIALSLAGAGLLLKRRRLAGI